MATSLQALQSIARGVGSFKTFLTTSHSSRPPGDINDFIVSPFKEHLAEDDSLRMCRVAGRDEWDRAQEVVSLQLQLVGGPTCRQVGNTSGVLVEDVKVYLKKRLVCSRQGKPSGNPTTTSSSSFSLVFSQGCVWAGFLSAPGPVNLFTVNTGVGRGGGPPPHSLSSLSRENV